MFHTSFGAIARHAAVAQVEHEAGIARGEAAELGRGHAGPAQEDFDFADEHKAALLSGLIKGLRVALWSFGCPRNPTCLGKILRVGRRNQGIAGNPPWTRVEDCPSWRANGAAAWPRSPGCSAAMPATCNNSSPKEARGNSKRSTAGA